MPDARLRHAIAFEAARLMYDRTESEYFTAKRKAASKLCRGSVKPSDLPSNREIRDQVQAFARMHEGDLRTHNLKAMRVAGLWLMRKLVKFRPRLIGSVMTGHIRQGSDIDLHLFSDSVGAITDLLDEEGLPYELERKQIVKFGESRTFTHIHILEKHPFELTVYAENLAHYVFKSSITGQAIERASIPELEQLIARDHPEVDLDHAMIEQDESVDPHHLFRLLLMPLDQVRQNPVYHPEGDVLYHLLQVFLLAREAQPWDEEFQLAALLHDIGKGIDPTDHVGAALEALDGLITPRTAWLIEHHMLAHEYRAGTLGFKARMRLEASEHFEDLMMLNELDRSGRKRGVTVPTVDEALASIRRLENDNAGK